jgi:hypothetical protein
VGVTTDDEARVHGARHPESVRSKSRAIHRDVKKEKREPPLVILANVDRHDVGDAWDLGIDVAAHGRDRSDGGQIVENVESSDVARVKNMVGPLRCDELTAPGMRPAMSVGDHDQTQRTGRAERE